MSKLCPCGSNIDYNECCRPIIEWEQPAPTAESLMRSRYTAFTIGDVDYLMKSWAEESRDLSEKESIKNWTKSVRWIKLKIISTSAGGINDIHGRVKFQAYYREKDKLKYIFEDSYFEKRESGWIYVSGIQK